jgi:hypothetical protein
MGRDAGAAERYIADLETLGSDSGHQRIAERGA